MPDYPKDDCYDALGVDHEASQDLIHATYIKLVKIYHPDPLSNASARDRAAAQEKLKRINEAYEILKDRDRRQNYDDWNRQKRQPPRPRVTPNELDFGALNPDESRAIRLTVENDGGPVTGEINFSMSKDPSYFRLGVNPSDGFPIHVDVTFDGSASGAGHDFFDSLTITLDGVPAQVHLRARVRPASATSTSVPPFPSAPHRSAPAGATPRTSSASSTVATPSSHSGPSRGWSIALGWIVFFLVLIFGRALANNAVHGRPKPHEWLAWFVVCSLFGTAALVGVVVTGLLRNKRKRATIAALLSVASAITFFILLGIGAYPKNPDLRVSLPVEDKMIGTSVGYPDGVQWQHALGDRGALFSAANASRIEYPGIIPAEGTLEFWIKVDSGYGYSNFQLRTNQDDAIIFSSDAQGGDVTWPGTTKFSVSRTGTLSYWMATSKYNKPPASATEARQTKFRFGEWHAIGVSYGRHGQYIMLDGKVVAASPGRTQTFGRAGNHQEPLDIPTIGETVSHFWPRHRLEGGFEGILAAFRVSASQRDWQLGQGVKGDITPDAIDATGSRSTDGGSHQWTELRLGDRKGDFSLDTDHHMYYRSIALRGFVIPAESDGAWVSPASPNGDVLCFSLTKNAQGFLIHLPTLTGTMVLDGSRFAFGLSAVQWTSWSPDGTFGLAAHYYEAHPELFVITTREQTARRVADISFAKENEEQVFDLESVRWESPDQFWMRTTINCNPYTTDTCTDDTRKRVLRTYDLVVNARSLEVSATIQPRRSSSSAEVPANAEPLKAHPVGQGVSAPNLISKVEPGYSDEARNAKLQGSVVLKLVVDERGLPQQITVIRSLGMGLDEKAIEAVQQWRFRPGMKDGHPVPVQATIEVNFKLL